MRPLTTNYQELTNESVPLPRFSCDFVILTAAPLTLDDVRIPPDANGTYHTTGKEVMWGIGNEAMHTLYVGQTSVLIPVENLNQICVKAINPSAKQIVVFSCFSEIQEQII